MGSAWTSSKINVSDDAVWLVSSSKVNQEIANLRDDSEDTFWQSDAALPHVITILFNELVLLGELEFYIDYDVDESYTPLDIIVRGGLARNDLFIFTAPEITKTRKSYTVSLLDLDEEPLPAHIVQISITSNYHDGRDSRIRMIKVWAHSTPPDD